MSHHDPFDRGQLYNGLLARGIVSSLDHLIAAVLASDVAEVEFTRAGEADSAGERRLFLRAADKARATRDAHELMADVVSALEPVDVR